MAYKHKPSKNKWAHRRLKWGGPDADPQRGEDVKALQRAFNALPVSVRGGANVKLKVDGEFGRHTLGRTRLAARALGIGLGGRLTGKYGLSVYVQHLIRHPNLRTPLQKKRGEAFRKEHPPKPPAPTVRGNKASGGTARERVVASCGAATTLYYDGKSNRFYSQPGTWTTQRGITGEKPGERSDCSQFATSMYWSADAPDPNGTGFTNGWTGSLAAHCKEIGREQLKPGDLVIYFNGPNSHHVEVYHGNGDGKTTYAQLARANSIYRDRTVGHGSPPVDFGDIDMIGGARFFRCPDLD